MRCANCHFIRQVKKEEDKKKEGKKMKNNKHEDECKKILKDAVNTFYDYQKMRISLEGRIRAGNYSVSEENIFVVHLNGFTKLEKGMFKYIKELLLEFNIWNEWLKDQVGIGPTIGGVLLSRINIDKCSTVSKMWAYSGIATGQTFGYKYNKKKKLWIKTDILIPIDKLTAGFRSPYDTFLKAKLLGVMAVSFNRSNYPYRKFYIDNKNRLISKNWGVSDGHRHNASMRYMVKMFEIDFHLEWRKLRGLSVRKSYKEEYLSKHGLDEV